MNATRILAGRREGELLAFPSVRHMTDILSQRCRESSWVRTSVASLERFRIMTGYADLEALREQAFAQPALAEQTLSRFALALAGYTDSQVSALAMGAKLWFRLNGITVPWRPLGGTLSPALLPSTGSQGAERVILLALIGSGLRLAELLRLRVGHIGSLDCEGRLIPDIEADPLAVLFTPRRGRQVERITFLTYQARQALLSSLEQAITMRGSMQLDAPLITQADGSPATNASVARARHRSQSLIRACSDTNVALCRATGDFFREWGLPGSRFVGPEELPMEEYL
jgi:hypothetical protein